MGAAGGFTLSEIEPGSAAYTEARRVRYDALYREWGLPRTLVEDNDGRTYRHLAAFDGGRVVGYGRLHLEDGACQIYQVAVARERRGEGIGKLLVDALVEWARDAQRDEVYLDSRSHVVSFYEHLGFEVCGEEFASPRTGTPHVRMRRRLDGDDDRVERAWER